MSTNGQAAVLPALGHARSEGRSESGAAAVEAVGLSPPGDQLASRPDGVA